MSGTNGETRPNYARNAWQQLGEMTPEMAMEQYIWLLSEKIPGWMRDQFRVSELVSSQRLKLIMFFGKFEI